MIAIHPKDPTTDFSPSFMREKKYECSTKVQAKKR